LTGLKKYLRKICLTICAATILFSSLPKDVYADNKGLEQAIVALDAWAHVDQLWNPDDNLSKNKAAQIANELVPILNDVNNVCRSVWHDIGLWGIDVEACTPKILAMDKLQRSLLTYGVVFAYTAKKNNLGLMYLEKKKGDTVVDYTLNFDPKDAAKAAQKVANGAFEESNFFHFAVNSNERASEYDKAVNHQDPKDPRRVDVVYRLWDENDANNKVMFERGKQTLIQMLMRHFGSYGCDSAMASGRCSELNHKYPIIREYMRFRGVFINKPSLSDFDSKNFIQDLERSLEKVTDPTRVVHSNLSDTELSKLLDEAIKDNQPPSRDISDFGFLGSKVAEKNKDDKYKASVGEQWIASIINGFTSWIFGIFDMQDVVSLVYGKNPDSVVDIEKLTKGCDNGDCREGKVYGVFDSGMFQAIDIFYTASSRYAPLIFVMAIVVIGLYIAYFGGDARSRIGAKDYMLGLILGIVALIYGPYLWDLIFAVNYTITDGVWALMLDHNIYVDNFLNMVWGNMGFEDFTSNRTLATAGIGLSASMMTATLNFQYAMRLIFLAILFSSFPLVCGGSVFPRYRDSLNIWWTEVTSNVFMDAIHAVALGVFFMSIHYRSDLSIWIFLAYFLGMGSIVALIRRVFKIDGAHNHMGGVLGGLGSMMGIGSLMSLVGMAKGNPSNGRALYDGVGAANDGGLVPDTNNGVLSRLGGSGLLRGALSTAAGLGGALASSALTGNPMLGARMGQGLGQSASGLLGATGKGMDNAFRAMSHDEGFFAGLEQNYMDGRGGLLNNAAVQLGWGAKSAFESLAGGQLGTNSLARGNAVQSYSDQLRSATDAVRALQPQHEAAKADFHAQKSMYGQGSAWYEQNKTFEPRPVHHGMPHPDLVNANEKLKAAQAEFAVAKRSGDEQKIAFAENQFAAAKNLFQEMDGEYGKGSAWYNDPVRTSWKMVEVAPEMPNSYVKSEQNYNDVNARYEVEKSRVHEARNVLSNRDVLYEKVKSFTGSGSTNPFRGTWI
jgi:hypothetical protein